MRLEKTIILLLTLGGFALRLHYLLNSHPFFDEYTSVLAARQILERGWPVLPSGLFYEHGLLATYLLAPFTALFTNTPVAEWQPAQWGLRLARWPSLLLGVATIPLIYAIGRRGFAPIITNPTPGPRAQSNHYQLPILRQSSGQVTNYQSSISLLAAGLFAFSPEGMVWGGRARMYALATLLILLAVYWAYRGAIYPAPAKYRWFALATLLAALLTQFGVLLLVLPLTVAMLIIGWRSWPGQGSRGAGEQGSGGAEAQGSRGAGERRSRGAEEQESRGAGEPGSKTSRPTYHASRTMPHASRPTHHVSRVWFLRPAILLEGAVLTAIIGLAIFVKRLGRPLGVESLDSAATTGNFLTELFNSTIAYQTTFYFTWAETIKFFSRQFGVPHHFWLTSATLLGIITGFIFWLTKKSLTNDQSRPRQVSAGQTLPITNYQLPITNFQFPFTRFLWLVFGLVMLEMVTLLEPFRRNPRYIVMLLPLFYLITAGAISDLWLSFQRFIDHTLGNRLPQARKQYARHISFTSRSHWAITAIILLIIFIALSLNDLRIAMVTPEPAYEKAFAHVYTEWQPGDVVLTMNTPAAWLYLGQVDGFTAQNEAEQFLLNGEVKPVDRWLGAPWIGDAAAFNAMLNSSERVWFVIDTIRQPVYFQGDWLALLNDQMERVWAEDNALVYRTRPNRIPLPTRPDRLVNATLGDSIQLVGYTLQNLAGQAPGSTSASPTSQSPNLQPPNLRLILFWQALVVLPVDYTVFLHVRNSQGATVVQGDRLPLDGVYPTSRWQPGETIIDPLTLELPEDLPAGTYQLFAGLYRLDTLERLPVANDTTGENAILLGEVVLP